MRLFTRSSDTPTVHAAQVLTAAGELVKLKDYVDSSTYRRLTQAWQKRTWGYYDSLGEVHFAANFVGNALARVNLYAAKVPTDIREAPEPTDDSEMQDIVSAMQGKRGGQSNLLRLSAMNLFLPGEYVLAHYADSWEVFSIDEFEVSEQKRWRRRGPGLDREELPSDGFYGRVWRPHPRYTTLADSPLRGVLNDCEALVLLGHQDRNLIRNRIAGSGLLLWPTELLEVEELDEEEEDSDAPHPLMVKIQEMMTTPLQDESSPSSVVPGVFTGPAEYLKAVQYLTFDRPLDARSEAKKQEAVRRIAVGVDLPPEVLLGLAEVNHWTAWQVREETFQQHLQPLVELVVDAWTVTYLRPLLESLNRTDADEWMIWYDADDLIARPDKSMQAVELHERIVISDEALREESGYDESDAPSDEERERRIAQAMMIPALVFPDADPADLGLAVEPSRVPVNDVPPTDMQTERDAQPGPATSPRPGA